MGSVRKNGDYDARKKGLGFNLAQEVLLYSCKSEAIFFHQPYQASLL